MDLKKQALAILVSLMLTAKKNLEGEPGTKMEAWVADRVLSVVEDNDQLIPMIKAYVDEPWADKLEATVVKQGAARGRELVLFAIRKAYAYAVANGVITAPETGTPEEIDADVAKALGVDPEEAKQFIPADGQIAKKTPEPELTEAGRDQFGNKQAQDGSILEFVNPAGSSTGNPANLGEPTPTPQPFLTLQPSQNQLTTQGPLTTNPFAQTQSPLVDAPDTALAADTTLFAYLQSNYATGGGWYTFEFTDENVEPHKEKGREAAKQYLLNTPEFADKYHADTVNNLSTESLDKN